MDRPLIYEKGWRKKLSYIIAYSRDEVQDVTWRYTRDYSGVMSRRNICSEKNLLKFIELLNARREAVANYSSLRRREVIKQRALELAGFLYIPNQQQPDDGESYGARTSGSHTWKLARGETTTEASSFKSYTWNISKYGKSFHLSYCVVPDTYSIKDDSDFELETRNGWQKGVHTIEGDVFRKVEDDWKVAYLARSPGKTIGVVKWCFEVKNPKLRIHSFKLRTKDKVFHEGSTSWKLDAFYTDGNQCKSFIINDCSDYCTDDLHDSKKLILTASVSGGSYDIAWQHAQLFRQCLHDKTESMILSITMVDAASVM